MNIIDTEHDDEEDWKMKLKSDFISQAVSDSHILVPIGKASQTFHGIVKANDTAGFIIECLKQDTTEHEIVEKMLMKYDVDSERATEGVRKVIAQLTEIGALE